MTGTITLLNQKRTTVEFDTEDDASMKTANEFFTAHTTLRRGTAFDLKTKDRVGTYRESEQTLIVPQFVGG
jgi:hypothetical protein